MPYLVDGYNLLYALGLVRLRAEPHHLEQARARLLGLVHGACGDRSGEVTVVFDSGPLAPNHLPHEQVDQGIHVRFSTHPENADDVIEQLIRRDSAPRQLTVVSDDHRIQKAARHRRCRSLACLDFMEELDRLRQCRPVEAEKSKEETLSEAELRMWLREFGEIDQSPEMKRLAEPPEFYGFDFDRDKD